MRGAVGAGLVSFASDFFYVTAQSPPTGARLAYSMSRWSIPHRSDRPAVVLDQPTKDWIGRLLKRWNVPGLSVAVVHRDNAGHWVDETWATGIRDSHRHPMTTDTRVSIASNSKLFTAIAVGLLIHDAARVPHSGEPLRWTTKMKDIFPEWRMTNKHAEDYMTLTDLLSMQSGLPSHDAALTDRPPSALLSILPHLPFSAQLREVWQYNNMHYLLASHIVALVAGEPFHEFVKRRVLDPLGMGSSTYNANEAGDSGKRADGFVQRVVQRDLQATWRKYAKQWDEREHTRKDGGPLELEHVPKACTGESRCFGCFTDNDNLNGAGDGGLWSTAEDWTKWLRELLDPQIIPPSVLHMTRQPHRTCPEPTFPLNSALQSYGFGTIPHELRGRLAYTHDGAVPGQFSVMVYIPDEQLGVAVLTNDETAGYEVKHVVAHELIDRYLGGHEPQGWERVVFGESLGGDDDDDDDDGEEEDDEDEDDYPEPKVDHVVGTYRHPAYPPVHLKALGPNDKGYRHLDLLNDALDDPINKSASLYLAEYQADFVSNFLLVHDRGRVFRWVLYEVVSVKQNGEETGEHVVLVDSEGECVLVPPDEQQPGLGMFGDFWGAGNEALGRPATTKNVPVNAEVWFARE